MLASSALILCACGGGGGGGDSSSGASSPPAPTEPSPSQQPPSQQPPSHPSPPGPVTLSGVVAANSALAFYSIDVLARPAGAASAKPSSRAGAKADADGRYTAALGSDVQPPFLLHALNEETQFPQYIQLYSITNHGGTANVTPLTHLLVARLLNRQPVGFNDPLGLAELQNRSDADIAAAQQQVVAYFLKRPSRDNGNKVSPVDVSAVTDFVSMPLVAAPGDPYFEALRRVHASLMDSETIAGVAEHMLFGNDPPADLRSIFALDFLADCTSAGALPQGRSRIVVDRRGTMFGAFNAPHGSRLSIGVNPGAGIASWVVQSVGSTNVEVSLTEGRVSSIRFFDEETPTTDLIRCVPVGEVSVAGKYPSATGLIRLLAQSIRNPVEGANTVAIEQNGALRINGPGGPSVHLPSFGFRIDAPLSMTTDGVAPTGGMAYNFVVAAVAVSDDGRITDLRF